MYSLRIIISSELKIINTDNQGKKYIVRYRNFSLKSKNYKIYNLDIIKTYITKSSKQMYH